MNTSETTRMIAAAQAAAEALGKQVTIVVVNSAGILYGLARAGEPGQFSSIVAEGKAAASALMGRDSGELASLAETYPAFINSMIARANGRFVAIPGAVVLKRGDEVAGAVGVSGATADEDEQIARAGAAAFQEP